MIHYLVIGHAAFEEQEWRHMMFNDEQPEEYLKAKFIKRLREDEYGWDEDKEIYVDFILQSNNLIHVNYG